MKKFWLLRAIKYFLIRGGIDNSEKSDTEPLMQARTRFALDFPIVDILHDEYRLDTDPLAQKIGGSTNEDFLDCRVFSSSSGSLGMH